MLAIQRWMKGKNILFVLLGPQLVITARDIHEDFQHIKERRIMGYQFPLPHLPSWFVLYRSHRKPNIFLRKLLTDFSRFGAETIQFGEDMIEGARLLSTSKSILPAVTPEAIAHAKAKLQNMLVESMEEIKDDISPQPIDPSVKARMVAMLQDMNIESSFFMLVTVPCWLIYRISPTRLYRKARQGNYASIKKLLCLDPLMIHDPVIGKKIQQLRFTNKTHKYNNLLETITKDHHLKVTSQSMKYAVGGFLSAIARILKKRLTAPDIHNLFNAVAKDFDGNLVDPELAMVESSFAREIYRYRQYWLEAFNTDTKK
jgi:hypothetical protein